MKGNATNLVVAVFIAALLAAFLLPIAVGAITDPAETSATQDVGEQIELKNGLTATVDATDTAAEPSTATYTISGVDGQEVTTTVGEGESDTVTVDGDDVTVSPTEVTEETVTTDYEYPITAGWSGGAASLWVILPLMMVLGVFLFFVGVAVATKS